MYLRKMTEATQEEQPGEVGRKMTAAEKEALVAEMDRALAVEEEGEMIRIDPPPTK